MRKDIKQMIDSNSDGLVTDEEIDLANKMHELQEKVRKSESQEKMAWVALVGILIFTAFLCWSGLFLRFLTFTCRWGSGIIWL